jgi:hypothetical protein
MSSKPMRFNQFRSDIRQLIDEVEQHLSARPNASDREYRLQREAFEERRSNARQLTAQIESNEQIQWGLRDGDAQRVHESLRLSLNYFRPDA